MAKPIYKRVILKISGEAIAGKDGFGIDPETIKTIAEEIKEVHSLGVELAIIVGGGNIWRGETGEKLGMDRAQADYMGMLATVMNGLALQDGLENIDVPTRVQTAISMSQVAEPYIRRRAVRHLEKGRVVIFSGGTGSPYFSTDTTAALRAAEIDADVIMMAKNNVDGVYSADPNIDETAIKYEELTYLDMINQSLNVMDITASSLSMDNEIPLVVFKLNEKGNIKRVILGENIGTNIRGINMTQAVLNKTEKEMTAAEQDLSYELGTIRAGRANASLLDNITVSYYGAETPLNQLAQISVPEARMIVIAPYDKSSLAEIEKAINKSDLGISPSNDGEVVRLVVPQLTEERRQEIAKRVGVEAEEAKISVRNIRRSAMEDLKNLEKGGEISEDEQHRYEQEIQKLTDASVKKIDELAAEKEKEIIEV